MNPGIPKGVSPKPYLAFHARLVFPEQSGEAAVLDLMPRFYDITLYPYNHPLEGKDRKGIDWEDGHLCAPFGLKLQKLREAEKDLYLKPSYSREVGRVNSPSSQKGCKAGLEGSLGSGKRLAHGSSWRVLKGRAFLPLLGFPGSQERWERGRDPRHGGRLTCGNLRFG